MPNLSTAPFSRRFEPIPGISGVRVWIPPPHAGLRVHVGHPPNREYSPEEESRWDSICAANPRAHDGEILAVHDVDFDSALIRVVRERYKRLAVQWTGDASTPPADRVRILGVKGFITARDHNARQHLLIGRRGRQTRVYAGLWESAPAGGVGVPPSAVSELALRDLAAAVEEEGEEELGLHLDASAPTVLAVCRDEIAGSDDVFLAFELPGVIDPRRSPSCQHASGGWEYSDTAWLARTDAPAFDQRQPSPLIAPVRAALRIAGWI